MDPMALNETFTLGFQGNIYETLAGYDGELKLNAAAGRKLGKPRAHQMDLQAAQGREIPRRFALHRR